MKEEKKNQTKGIRIATVVLQITVILVVIALIVQTIMGFQARSRRIERVQSAIDTLGSISMESGRDIEAAEEMLRALPEKEQDMIANRDVLSEARKEYQRLEALLQTARDAFNAIQTPITVDSKEAIEKARTAFDALAPDHLTEYVKNEEERLTNFEILWEDEYALSLVASGEELYEQGQYGSAMEKFYDVMDNHPSRQTEAREQAVKTMEVWAKACYDEKDYKSALNRLKEAEDRALTSDALTQLRASLDRTLAGLRPANGSAIQRTIAWGHGEFEVTAGDQDLCFKLVSKEDSQKCAVVFVRKNETAKINVADGSYVFKYTQGDNWFGNDKMFGSDAKYAIVNDDVEYSTTYSGSWVYYSTMSFDASKHTIGEYGIPEIPIAEW